MKKTEANSNVLDFDFRGQQYAKYWGYAYAAFFIDCGAEWYRSDIISENNVIFA